MLIPDISATVEQLAGVVSKKYEELAKIKTEYENKLRYLNLVIERVNPSGDIQNTIDEDTFDEIIRKSAFCPNCQHKLSNMDENHDYVILPKLKANLRSLHTETQDSAIVQLAITELSLSKREKTKKICSYCHKPGHTRARCFLRLNTEPNLRK